MCLAFGILCLVALLIIVKVVILYTVMVPCIIQ